LEGDDVGGGEVGEVGWLEWKVFERHRSRGGWSGERKERDNGEDVGLRGGGCMRVPSGVDWELTRETRGKRAKEDRDRSGLRWGKFSGSKRVERWKGVRSWVPVPKP